MVQKVIEQPDYHNDILTYPSPYPHLTVTNRYIKLSDYHNDILAYPPPYPYQKVYHTKINHQRPLTPNP